MFAIIDSRSHNDVINNLREYVEGLFEFETYGTTCNSISGHPDIFIYQDNNQLVIAPNAPVELFEFLENHNIIYVRGKREVGDELYNSVQYNCLSTPDYVFHKQEYTDPAILGINKDKEFIPLPQAYTRCSLVHLCENNYLTSDRGIERVLIEDTVGSGEPEAGQLDVMDVEVTVADQQHGQHAIAVAVEWCRAGPLLDDEAPHLGRRAERGVGGGD